MGRVEEAKGKVKETAGDIAGDDELAEEGRAQYEKGQAGEEARRARVEAEEREAEERQEGARERAAQALK